MIAIKPASFLRSKLSAGRIGDVMLKFAAVAWIVLWSIPAGAIRWEFDDGTTQGWFTKENLVWGGEREFHQFPGVVEDGVWRIAVDPAVTKGNYSTPVVELISPTIGYDSGLFDQVRIRCRTVHHRPTIGKFSVAWTNEHNALPSGWDLAFGIGAQDILYTTEWQEVVLVLAGRDEKIWEGILKDIRLGFSLDRSEAESASDVVEWFEIDWIELTGVEELLQGELPPPQVEYLRWDEAGLFAPPLFYSIAPGTGHDKGLLGGQPGVLTDLDGDGALDLFAVWSAPYAEADQPGDQVGWLMALNDGHGGLELKRLEEVVPAVAATEMITGSGVLLAVLGADLTGDGQDEIALYASAGGGEAVGVWSIGKDLQVEVLVQIADRGIVGAEDWDGDGRVELFVGGSTLEVWDVEQGVWMSSEVAAIQNHVPYRVGDFTGDGILDVVWIPIVGQANTWGVGALGDEFQRNEVFEFEAWKPLSEGGNEAWKPLLGVGDFDGDGQVDVLTEFTRDRFEGSKGLVWLSNSTGGTESAVLYDDRLFRRSPVLVDDLNADGVDDWVFIGGDRASGFGVFVEWGGSVKPTQAGERHRLTGTATRVLSGDMDGDGDEDLVVLDPISGGVHVLKSSLASLATAVQMSAAARPAQYRLGDSYPNPFNPAVVLPLDLAKDAMEVSLRVHDVLGRRVRQVWQGPLRAGQHRFVWDGRDEEGKAVAAGVYIYRVEMDGRVEAKKTTKLP